MAGMLNYYFLIWAVIMRISGRHLAPKATPQDPNDRPSPTVLGAAQTQPCPAPEELTTWCPTLNPSAGASSSLHLRCLVLYPKCMSCHWTPQDGAASNTTFHLRYKRRGVTEAEECKDYVTSGPNSCYFSRTNLCLYLTYEIWVEAGNQMSEKLIVNTEDIAKTEPPEGLKATGFGTHFSVEWGYPPGVAASYFPLVFELQYQEQGSGEWEQEPDVGEQTSYYVYDVKPDTVYLLAVRCKNSDGKGFWSDWSTPVTVSSGQATAKPVQSQAQ
ncbi:cytokine receptor-like factor 1 isoform X1 [Chelonia mydas]|uniref:cytokine receptor-like factor 1 isoform X1 n=1 Tax=Chelonia mydas TaxID=8469 RepID=UPI001CA8491F|nr:cytokine receptor-like factor 1 isoform X1 [Chelonia mydas]XP_043376994.1 cytokine receptor-like factor 1 isoform X1 [Chelonia mydas]